LRHDYREMDGPAKRRSLNERWLASFGGHRVYAYIIVARTIVSRLTWFMRTVIWWRRDANADDRPPRIAASRHRRSFPAAYTASYTERTQQNAPWWVVRTWQALFIEREAPLFGHYRIYTGARARANVSSCLFDARDIATVCYSHVFNVILTW